jgi:hypothetical protein
MTNLSLFPARLVKYSAPSWTLLPPPESLHGAFMTDRLRPSYSRFSGALHTLALAGALCLFAAPSQAQEQKQEHNADTVVVRGPAPAIKPPLRGLISMGAYKFVGGPPGTQPDNNLAAVRAKPGILGGIVIVPSWQQLQPTQNGGLQTRVIDNMLNQIRIYNSHHPDHPLAAKLRVWGGFMAPLWAKKLNGTKPIPVIQNQGQQNEQHRTLGHFWTPAYRTAWANLQTMLAQQYDNEPLIREVSITSCMALTAEPFVVNTEPTVMNRLRRNGFTDEAFKDCVTGALDDYAPWKQTRLVLSVNPLHLYHVPGPGDPEFTKTIMAACRDRYGAQCVFDNHDLNVPLAKPLCTIYAYMATLGPEIEFQTANIEPADFPGTIMFGVNSGASSIELYQDFPKKGGFPKVADATLRQWSRWLARNTGASTGPFKPPHCPTGNN